MKTGYLLVVIAFGIVMSISCEKSTELLSKSENHRINDGELLEIEKAWEAGHVMQVSELLSRLGDPVDKAVKNGKTIYSWCGAEELWLFAGIDTDTGEVTGVSVRSRY